MEKRKAFIINLLYFVSIILIAFLVIKYGLPRVAPFVIAFMIAYFLKWPIRFLAKKFHINQKATAIIMVLLFYSTIGLVISLAGIKLLSEMKVWVMNLPEIYAAYVEPTLMQFFDSIEESLLHMDAELVMALEEMSNQFVSSIGQMVSSLSMEMLGGLSGFASGLPSFFIQLLLMIICTFFIAADYDQLTGFVIRQMNEKTKNILMQIKEYVAGTLFVCIRSYALIMGITFVELSIGLTLVGVENSILVALSIAIFDILPVLGTGGIMIPWAVITLLQGSYSMGISLLIVYLVVTIIRNIIEPKIVGSQIGLHPVVTLISMFIGAQLFGILGLFGFPIGISLLCHLNDNGVIHLFHIDKISST